MASSELMPAWDAHAAQQEFTGDDPERALDRDGWAQFRFPIKMDVEKMESEPMKKMEEELMEMTRERLLAFAAEAAAAEEEAAMAAAGDLGSLDVNEEQQDSGCLLRQFRGYLITSIARATISDFYLPNIWAGKMKTETFNIPHVEFAPELKANRVYLEQLADGYSGQQQEGWLGKLQSNLMWVRRQRLLGIDSMKMDLEKKAVEKRCIRLLAFAAAEEAAPDRGSLDVNEEQQDYGWLPRKFRVSVGDFYFPNIWSCEMKTETFNIPHVEYPPEQKANLVSLNQLDCDSGQQQKGWPVRLRPKCMLGRMEWLGIDSMKMDVKKAKWRKQLLVFAAGEAAMLATTMTMIMYQVARRSPAWGNGLLHETPAGDPILRTKPYIAAFNCIATAFLASVFGVMVAVAVEAAAHWMMMIYSTVRKAAGTMVLTLLLAAALVAVSYQACLSPSGGFSPRGKSFSFVASLFVSAIASAVTNANRRARTPWDDHLGKEKNASEEVVWKMRKYILLLAVLAATVTYQAGLNPPGGYWHHDGGYKTAKHQSFFWSNSVAFAASLVVIIMMASHGPVLLKVPPRLRRTAFFYFNSVTFVLSVALITVISFDSLRFLGKLPARFLKRSTGTQSYMTHGYIDRTDIYFYLLMMIVECGRHHIVQSNLTDERNDKPRSNGAAPTDSSDQTARASVPHNHLTTGSGKENLSDPDACGDERHASGAKPAATWYVATGAARHATGDRSLFRDLVVEPENDGLCVHAADGTPMPVRGRGNVVTDTVELPDVYYVPGLWTNLVSVGQLAELDYSVGFGRGACIVNSAAGRIVGRAHAGKDGLYEVDYLRVPLNMP